jgi:hypothetical protein
MEEDSTMGGVVAWTDVTDAAHVDATWSGDAPNCAVTRWSWELRGLGEEA